MKIKPGTIATGVAIAAFGGFALDGVATIYNNGQNAQREKDASMVDPLKTQLSENLTETAGLKEKLKNQNKPRQAKIAIGKFTVVIGKTRPITGFKNRKTETGDWAKSGKFGTKHPSPNNILIVTNPEIAEVSGTRYFSIPDDNNNPVWAILPTTNKRPVMGIYTEGYTLVDCLYKDGNYNCGEDQIQQTIVVATPSPPQHL